MERVDEIRERISAINAEVLRLRQERADLERELVVQTCPYKVGSVAATKWGGETRLWVVTAIYPNAARGYRAECYEVTADGRQGQLRTVLDGVEEFGQSHSLYADSLVALAPPAS